MISNKFHSITKSVLKSMLLIFVVPKMVLIEIQMLALTNYIEKIDSQLGHTKLHHD